MQPPKNRNIQLATLTEEERINREAEIIAAAEEGATEAPVVQHALSERERAFVHFLTHENMTPVQAMQAAGYVLTDKRIPGYSSRRQRNAEIIMARPVVALAIQAAREEYVKASRIERQSVINGFLEAIELARDKGDPMVMVNGWKEIGKMLGHYEPSQVKVVTEHRGEVTVRQLQTMTNEQLLQFIEGEAKDVTPTEPASDG